MPIQPNFLERAAFYTLNQAPGVMLDMAGALSYQTLSTAIQLGVFDALAEKPMTGAQLAVALNAQPRAIDALMAALAAIGYIESLDGYYANSTMTRKWLLDSEAFNGRAILRFWNDVNTDIWPQALEIIRTGQRPQNTYDWIESNPDRNRSFQQTLAVTAVTAGPVIATKLDLPPEAIRILDVAGGHGLFSIILCQHYPNLRATIIERPAALAVAADYIAEHGLTNRIDLVSGDLWEVDWGSDYDAVLLFNLLHHFDLVTNSKLMRKASHALHSGGTVAILDQIAGKVSGSATNAIIRLMALQYYIMADGRVFTEDELGTELANNGFDAIRTHNIPRLPGTSLMTASKR